MDSPNRAIIKSRKHVAALVHVRETAQPDEAIGVLQITEWTDNTHSERFLRFNELAFKQIDQPFPSPIVQRILPKFHHRTIIDHRNLFPIELVDIQAT